jgi:hypothetical protein
MKENRLIIMENKIKQLTNVVNGLIQKLQQVDIMAKGTLTAFQLHIGEKKWKELVIDMQAIEGSKKESGPKEKKFEDVE